MMNMICASAATFWATTYSLHLTFPRGFDVAYCRSTSHPGLVPTFTSIATLFHPRCFLRLSPLRRCNSSDSLRVPVRCQRRRTIHPLARSTWTSTARQPCTLPATLWT
ncbi:hypothetical protein OH76DRAFT_1053189 [Lentinus brumalis]|uniref:Uncharacterized protein n=1 Tax=Lentinus brumalis TaxID=2498619 RepID=A0A371CWL3_9APHY|nr:hypothetical protein OH76DRAFT_1053189 [Polyporus brumalis]